MKTNKLLLSAAFVAISASGFSAVEGDEERVQVLQQQNVPAYEAALFGTDTKELLESINSGDLTNYINMVSADVLTKANFFFDSLEPGPFDRLLDDSLNFYDSDNLDGSMTSGGSMTRDNFKHGLQVIFESMCPVFPSFRVPVNATLASLLKTKEQVVMTYVEAIFRFLNSIASPDDTLMDESDTLKRAFVLAILR
ncbi:MAG: hypothetical protein WCJ92_07110 [Alphaproteobacteria bacterium]